MQTSNLPYEIPTPTALYIDLSSICQLRCPTCLITDQKDSSLKSYLRFQDFKSILDENPQISSICFENRGEMFMNPDLIKIFEYAHSKNITMDAPNGVNLNNVKEGMLEALVKCQLRVLLCSIDGATPETYSIYRKRGNFDRVIENIRLINDLKKSYDLETPRLIWQFVVFGHNEHELPLAREMAHELGMSFVPKMSWDSSYSPIRDEKFVMEETGWPAASRESYLKLTKKSYMREVCYALWRSPLIGSQGQVMGCCWNTWRDFGSNIGQGGYAKSINSSLIRQSREMLLGEAESVEGSPCTSCPLYQERKDADNHLTIEEIHERSLEELVYRPLSREPV